MVHFVRHDLCSCGSPKSPLRLGIMSQYLPEIFQTFMLTIWHTQKVPYACALDCANMAQIACKIGYFVSGQECCNRRRIQPIPRDLGSIPTYQRYVHDSVYRLSCACGSPKSPLRLGIMSQYLPGIFQTFMLTIWHTQKCDLLGEISVIVEVCSQLEHATKDKSRW